VPYLVTAVHSTFVEPADLVTILMFLEEEAFALFAL
jgi:hypothetical protein